MSNENPTLTQETIKTKIKGHGEQLQQVTTRITNLRTELEQLTSQHMQLVGAIKGLQDLLNEENKPIPSPPPEPEKESDESTEVASPAEDS